MVHLLAPAPFGGLERVVEMLAVGQRAAGHEVHVVVSIGPDPDEHPFVATLKRRQVPVIELRGSPRAYRAEYRQLQAIFARVKPDIVHTHGYRSDLLGVLAARRVRIATVSTAHGFTGGGLKGSMYEWIQRATWRMHTAVIAVSQPLVARLRAAGLRHERVHLVPNGWSREGSGMTRADARAALGLPTGARLIGWVGRLSQEKGPDVMLDAMPHVAADIILVMVGDGPERTALDAQAARLGLGERVRWLGAVPEAGKYFSAFDGFVLSSRTEGTPIALFEAVAAGVPVVATAVGGVPEVVTEREALLVRPEDPAALGAAVARLTADPAATALRAAAASLRLESQYGVEAWVRRYDEVYAAARANAS